MHYYSEQTYSSFSSKPARKLFGKGNTICTNPAEFQSKRIASCAAKYSLCSRKKRKEGREIHRFLLQGRCQNRRGMRKCIKTRNCPYSCREKLKKFLLKWLCTRKSWYNPISKDLLHTWIFLPVSLISAQNALSLCIYLEPVFFYWLPLGRHGFCSGGRSQSFRGNSWREREALGFHFRTFLFAVPLLCCIVGFCKGLDCLPQSARKPRQWTGRGNHGNRSAALWCSLCQW